jgi:PAS domain S-box-containing protein
VWSDHLRRIFRIQDDSDRLSLETFLQSVHPDDRLRVHRALIRSIVDGLPFDEECRIARVDGEQQWVSGRGQPEYDADGRPLRILGVALDITAAKRAHEETARREAQLAEAQAIAHVGSYEWDVEDNRFRRSAELCRIFGVESEDFEPTLEGYLARVHPDDREATRLAIEGALSNGTPFEFEERIVRPDGAVRVLHSKGRWIRGDEPRPMLLVGMSQDVTERRQAVEILEESVAQRTLELRRKNEELENEVRRRREVAELLRARNDELKAFAYTVSHDLKAPLRGIAGYAKELERRHSAGLSERADFCLRQILSATRNLDQLIEDLLMYARLDAETPTPTRVDPAGLIEAIVRERQPVIQEQRTQVTVHATCSSILVWERGFRQVLTNLIDNAIKYSRQAATPSVRIEAEDAGDLLRISITDNGIGFDMKYHDRMFGLFNRLVRQEEFEGTGAGLAIVRKVLDKIGGRVWAESASPGAGATFFVEVPRGEPAQVAVAV